jgi:DNA polymerase III sliding clamp (beta) subunit (PCNA family)
VNHHVKVRALELAREVAWVTKGSKSKFGVAALSSVEVTAVVGALSLRRTDLELWRESVIPVDGGGQASVLVDPVKLKSLTDGVVARGAGNAVIGVAADALTISTDGTHRKLRSAAKADEFPDWPVFQAVGKPAVLSAEQVARALTSTRVDDSLPMLTGVRFEDGSMVSTDRFRLTVITYADKGFTALVPGAALRAFTDGVVSVQHGKFAGIKVKGVDGGAVRISSGGRSIVCRELDAEFPKWRNQIQSEEDYGLVAFLRRRQLLEAIDGGDHVTVTLRDGAMTITSADRDQTTEIEQDIDADVLKGDELLPFTARYNRVFLTGIVKNIQDGTIRFFASEPVKPIVLKGSTDDELHLLMPVRMPS